MDGINSISRRRLLVGSAAWPVLAFIRAARAQPKQTPILIGWLGYGTRQTSWHQLDALKEGLAELGRKEGLDVAYEERWAESHMERLQLLAEELAARKPVLIVATPNQSTAAATKAAPNTPIIHVGGDPVATGLVSSLARPGGMVTGVTNLTASISEKLLELLLAAVPKASRIGFLFDAKAPTKSLHMENVRRAVSLHAIEARYAEAVPNEIDLALSRLAKDEVRALVVPPSVALTAARRQVVDFALARRWPVIGISPDWTEAGALLSYGADQLATFRRAAYYVDRILKGDKPGDLPIEQPTKFELVVNLKTAKALGTSISHAFLMRADRVIE